MARPGLQAGSRRFESARLHSADAWSQRQPRSAFDGWTLPDRLLCALRVPPAAGTRDRPTRKHSSVALAVIRYYSYAVSVAEERVVEERIFVTVQSRGLIAILTGIRRQFGLDRPGAQVEVVERDGE